jgi:hypothetical protein
MWTREKKSAGLGLEPPRLKPLGPRAPPAVAVPRALLCYSFRVAIAADGVRIPTPEAGFSCEIRGVCEAQCRE